MPVILKFKKMDKVFVNSTCAFIFLLNHTTYSPYKEWLNLPRGLLCEIFHYGIDINVFFNSVLSPPCFPHVLTQATPIKF